MKQKAMNAIARAGLYLSRCIGFVAVRLPEGRMRNRAFDLWGYVNRKGMALTVRNLQAMLSD